jgi:hypothetical protein
MCLLRALREAAAGTQPSSESVETTVVNVDCNEGAYEAATALHKSLGGWSKGMEFVCSDAATVEDLEEFDVVFLAALVGITQEEKENMALSIARRMRPGALLVARSAYGMRTVLYPVSNTLESASPIRCAGLILTPCRRWTSTRRGSAMCFRSRPLRTLSERSSTLL